ncbi:MAG: glycine cleavage system aminomethyltransferase GcvT [Dehalococcoidia bacterium]|nr:glycine cleavage system aminomethyltransferase GcvT [Dehalococcoidia bacterium]
MSTDTNADNLRTALYQTHVDLGARMVPFGGWDMPVQYQGTIAEVEAVRTDAGIFDVSHMGRLHIGGPNAAALLDILLTGSASSLRAGRARYCFVCNEEGGVIDDTIFYRLSDDEFLLIPNAGNRAAVALWFDRQLAHHFDGRGVQITDRTMLTGLIALQGPAAAGVVDRLCEDFTPGARLAQNPGRTPGPSLLRPFTWGRGHIDGRRVFIGRTGYTGEDGFELAVGASDAVTIWQKLYDAGATPCGLGARDVLRLEAGLPLHGHELTDTTTPIEAGLSRFVRRDGGYNGADVLDHQRVYGTERQLIGLTLPGRSAPRADYEVLADGAVVGTVSSGSYSPTLGYCIAMAFVDSAHAAPGTTLTVDIRGRPAEVTTVELPFYQRSG